ncbi:MAG: tetratricopeptide repeat protein, partial [Candidatus Methylomirabilia bacterium]
EAQVSEADVFVAQAILAYEEKRYDGALSLLREALEVDPENIDAYYYAGLVHLARKDFDAAVEALEKARDRAPSDLSILFQLGVAHFSQERYDKAGPLLAEVFKERPRTDAVGYYVGFMRYRRKDYQGALRAFQAGTSTDPNIQQLTRFYAGLTLAILGLPERAAAEVEESLRLQPVSPLTGPAERLRDTILAARERERRFRAEVRLGSFYDTNVPVAPEPSDDRTAEDIRRQNRNRQSFGELLATRLEYVWLRTGPWEATVTYSFFQTFNNEVPSFNIQNHLGALGGFYRGAVVAMPYQVGALYAFDFLTLDNDEFIQRNTATLFGTLVENAGNLTTLQTRLQLKEFSEDDADRRGTPEEVRDARNWMLGFLHVFRFEADKHLLRLGYQFDVEDADGSNFEYVGNRILAGGQYTLPWRDTRLSYDIDLHFRNYSHDHSLLPAEPGRTRERVDTEITHLLRAEQPLPRDLTLSAEYQVIVSRSNLDVFSFNRNVLSLTLSWQF